MSCPSGSIPSQSVTVRLDNQIDGVLGLRGLPVVAEQQEAKAQLVVPFEIEAELGERGHVDLAGDAAFGFRDELVIRESPRGYGRILHSGRNFSLSLKIMRLAFLARKGRVWRSSLAPVPMEPLYSGVLNPWKRT